MEQPQRQRRQKPEPQPEAQPEPQVLKAGETEDRTAQLDKGERKGWHKRALPSGGHCTIYDGF